MPVNGTYYVIEAIPDSKHKKFWVVSAYMENANTVTQAPNAKSPRNTPKASLASPVSAINSIPTSSEKSNSENGNVLYTKDGKSINELLTQRRQVPKLKSEDTSSTNSIAMFPKIAIPIFRKK